MALEILHSPQEWTARFGCDMRAAVTIGNFDGVHLGHQKILRSVVERARRTNSVAAALTFDPHPFHVVRPDAAPQMIETLEQRLARIEALGLDAVLVLHFDSALASSNPEEFVHRILGDCLHVCAVLVGENFRFGHRQAGDVNLLRKLGAAMNFDVGCIAPVVVRGTVVSSTAVRAAVTAGRMTWGARLLGRPFLLAGEIKPGTGTGRHFVFPTLNLSTTQELLPARGVYATEAIVDGELYRAATNVGMRPTFDGTQLSIESHLFDFSKQVTSGSLEIRFWRRLRDEKKFSGTEALREQIQRDIIRARSFFLRLDGLKLPPIPTRKTPR
ncbi:MAG TPA: bifunctional riboflavin kinase/FAD synthetase [Candidatus Acidoferrales bacterium]|nr:bifunctional riboflavin kinase/FAD synthetase [Candidatus Acidoferrales bacterium]